MLSAPRAFYGVHSGTPYRRDTGAPYGEFRVVGGITISGGGETDDLIGGSARYPWHSEDGPTTFEATTKVKEFPDFLFELFGGTAPTSNAAEATGAVSALTNKSGTSLMNASTGIASVGKKSGQNASLKFAKYVVKAASATTVDVYVLSDVDQNRGTAFVIQDDAMKITATPLTITTLGAATEIPGTGLELIGGSGAIAMTAGDTATFEARPINSKSMTVTIGGLADEYPEFGLLALGQKRGNGEMVELDFYRCKAGPGFTLPLEEKKWAETELKMKLLYDSVKDGVYAVRTVKP